jgi:hypothetical protein
MYPGQTRIKELRARFKIHNGQVLTPYKYKNLNWYLAKDVVNRNDPGEWFNFGDVDEILISLLPKRLQPGEFLVLGWKDLGPNDLQDDTFGNGGGVWLVISPSGILYDVRRDGRIKEPN